MRINVIPEAGWKWRATKKVKISKYVSRQGEHELLLNHTTAVSRDICYTGGQRMGWMSVLSNVCKRYLVRISTQKKNLTFLYPYLFRGNVNI